MEGDQRKTGNVCPQCGHELIRAYLEDGGLGDWCPNCKKGNREVKKASLLKAIISATITTLKYSLIISIGIVITEGKLITINDLLIISVICFGFFIFYHLLKDD